MATYTDNYHLSKPETTDSQQSFMEDYATNMDIIDENMGGGGGGGGGHTIVNPAGTDMAQEPKMQFAGKVSVTDDDTNEKTVVVLPEEVKEVTLAEYIALGDVVNTDGKLYCITDLNNSDVQGYPPIIYSDEEREVGVWRDGKPLYQKTIYYQGGTNGQIGIPHGIANIEKVVFASGRSRDNYSSSMSYEMPLPRIATDNYNVGISSVDGTNINFAVPSAFGSRIVDIYITLQYTKTTDVAGSGIWNGQGGYAHHYSTSEKVIGTWIDGKPLYEKTLDCGYGVPSGGSLIQPIGVSDIAEIINWNVWSTNGAFSRLFPYVNDTGSVRVDVDINNGNIRLYPMGISLADQKVYAVLQYTKTTD